MFLNQQNVTQAEATWSEDGTHEGERAREWEMEMVKGEPRDLPLLDYHGALRALLHNLVKLQMRTYASFYTHLGNLPY